MADSPHVSEPTDYPMTAAQKRVLGAMDSSAVRLNDALPPDKGTFWQVALGVVGVGLLLAGCVLVFFFAALGAVVIAAGGLSLIAALQGARVNSAAQSEVGDLLEEDSLKPPTTH